MDYLYKRLEASDVEDFKKLLLVFLRVFKNAPYDTGDNDLKMLLERPDYYVVAAFDKDIVIGGATGYELKLPNTKNELYMYDLAVEEKYRKQGIATALVDELKVHAKKNDVSVMFVEAETNDHDAVGFYRSLGAEQIKVEHFNIKM